MQITMSQGMTPLRSKTLTGRARRTTMNFRNAFLLSLLLTASCATMEVTDKNGAGIEEGLSLFMRTDASRYRPLGQAIADSQTLQACPPFSGKSLWDNGVRFTVAGEPVTDVSDASIRAVFDAMGIPTTAGEIGRLTIVISQVAGKAVQFKGKSIDLMNVLAQIRKTR